MNGRKISTEEEAVKKLVLSSVVAGLIVALLLYIYGLFDYLFRDSQVDSFVLGAICAYMGNVFSIPNDVCGHKVFSLKNLVSWAIIISTMLLVALPYRLGKALDYKQLDISFGWMMLGCLFSVVAMIAAANMYHRTYNVLLVKLGKEDKV